MSQDDPFDIFGDDEKTRIRPSPGGRRASPAPAATRPPATPRPELPQEAEARSSFGDNPLITQAASLLSLVSRLRSAASLASVEELRQELINEMHAFGNGVLGRGVDQEQARSASYGLCSLIDETVLNTPWGARSNYSHRSLLVQFHRETQGGERFFEILRRLVQQPAQNLYLLELFFLCLSLGFEGKFRQAANGAATLEQMRSELFRLIQRVRGDPERELSPRWQGLKDLRPAIIRYTPLWVVVAAAAALLALVFLGFLFAINSASDPLFSRISTLSSEELPQAEPAAAIKLPPRPRTERFKPLLTNEIGAGLVEVPDDFTLRIHNSFRSGCDEIKPEFLPMLKKIAAELVRGGDRVVVRGHTDNIPIHSVRFPSNFDLSTARARNVAEILEATSGLAGKVRYEGRADTEPLVPNNTPANQAMNRRVDILIK